MIKVCLPGTGSVMPLENRHLPCCTISHQGKVTLIDCGEGTQLAVRKTGFKLSRIDTILITHFHADHISGLPGLLLTMGNSGKKTPLTIIGPEGLAAVVDGLRTIAPVLPYEIHVVEWVHEPFRVGELIIQALPLSHRIPCLGYSVTHNRKPVFNPQKAKAFGVAQVLWGKLHAGETVTLTDSTVITPDMVTDGIRPTQKICYMTDTAPFDSIIDFIKGADLLICEGMHGDEALRDKLTSKGHMLFSDSAALACAAGVKKLWLTHFSPALTEPESYLQQMKSIFSETEVGFDGIKTII